jgi:hypothetical protein
LRKKLPVAPLEACTRYGAKGHLLPRLFCNSRFFSLTSFFRPIHVT